MPSQSRFFSTSGVRSLIVGVVGRLQVVRERSDFLTLPGLVRELCRNVPPVRPARLTISSVRI